MAARETRNTSIKSDNMWKELTSEATLNEIVENSATKPQIIYKHSTRCPLSSMVKSRLQAKTLPEQFDFYELDLIAHRQISNKIADQFAVWHESPQVIIVVNGEAVYDESHMAIRLDEVIEEAGNHLSKDS